MGMDVGSHKGGVKSDINVTPLVDIVLVLLIIFIVITPAVSNAVSLPLSKQSFKQEMDPGSKYLSLILTRSNEKDPETGLYKMKDVQVDDRNAKDKHGNPLVFGFEKKEQRESLIKYVKDNVDNLRGDKRVFIKADSELPFGYVNELFQICREAGADEASVVTSEDKSAKEQ
ncbi:MAG: biopolymer transporter ExbD [Holophagales bacterium]|jgi:biopolymer transport protein ExbD/biopolymer transport protein TolR|nr:biopolymer transporter ExbD [Holophagales bacterium]